MISGLGEKAARKQANKIEVETEGSGKMTASVRYDEFLLKPKGIFLIDFDGT